MGRFLNHLDIRDTEKENADYRALWQLINPFGYRDDTGWEIWVPAYYVTDFGSIPRMFWRIEPPTGRARRATVIHDWLYSCKIIDRKKCDEIFREAMQACGVPLLKRNAMFQAVRFGGAGGYGRKDEFEQAKWLLDNADLPLPFEGIYG